LRAISSSSRASARRSALVKSIPGITLPSDTAWTR
jgi:hypothetical protein